MVVFGSLLAIALYDLYIVVQTGSSVESVSQTITDISHKSPFLVFMCGAVVDHFFGWTMNPSVRRCLNCNSLVDSEKH